MQYLHLAFKFPTAENLLCDTSRAAGSRVIRILPLDTDRRFFYDIVQKFL